MTAKNKKVVDDYGLASLALVAALASLAVLDILMLRPLPVP